MLRLRSTMRPLAASLLVGPVLLLLALVAPAMTLAAGPITSSACDLAVPDVATCNLWAKTGTLSLPSTSTPIWGFTATASGTAGVPGPTLIVRSGDAVTVNLTNQLSVPTSILFEGQSMVPDLTGVAGSGGIKAYTFTAGSPGTYLYEAGLIPGDQYQVAKGLYGALIVRPEGSPMQANDDASSLFADEALVVLGEVDTALNSSSNPAGFDLRAFAPRYFLINGKAYPQTTPITTTAGNRLLLRYVNAGLRHHSMGVLGLRQSVVNEDGTALSFPRPMVAESIAPGQSLDVLVDIPLTAASSTKHLLYDASMGLNNSTATGTNAGIGGMLTIVDAAGTPVGGDSVGPLASNVAVDPGPMTLSATISDAATGGGQVAAAEYFVDTLGAPGTGTPMTGSLPADPAAVSASLGALSGPSHTIYVRGQDTALNWGPASSVSISIDAMGPLTTGVVISPRVSDRTTAVAVTATADDTAKGGSAILSAEYFIDIAGADGSGVPMNLNTTSAPISSLSGTVSAATVSGLSVGNHQVLVHARDAAGNWGATQGATLTVDITGPTTTALSASPNPNNGTRGFNSSTPAVRVVATFDDVAPAFVKTGELFVDVVGAPGSGIPIVPSDGLFDGAHELGYADVLLATVAQLPNGNHLIFVRGKDSAGNWGPTASTTLTIDKVGPTTSGVTLTPPAANAQAVAISATGNDVTTGNSDVVSGEWFIDVVGTDGTGAAMTAPSPSPTTTVTGTIPAATTAALSAGNHTLYIHSRDRAGAWGPRVSVVLKIDRTAPTFSSISLTPSSIAAGTATTTLHVNGSGDGASGSGVVGGEYWIANSNVPAGGGTAFTGLNPAISTGTLVPGSYTVRVRIRDAAENWSTGNNGVRTTTLTVTGPVPPTIFTDGFELQTVPGTWTSSSTTTASRLDVTAAAAMTGSLGLQAQGNSNPNYVQYTFGTAASPAASIFDARFQFRPNARPTSGQDIFAAATNNGFGTQVLRVRYRLNGSTPQVQLQVGTANSNGTWTNLLGGTSVNTIEVVREAVGSGGSNPGTARLYVNGALSQSLTTTSSAAVGAFRLGAVTNNGNNSTIRLHFDGFAAKRTATPLYGP